MGIGGNEKEIKKREVEIWISVKFTEMMNEGYNNIVELKC